MTIEITRKSPLTGEIRTRSLDITAAEMHAYDNGILLQYAFPRLDTGEREFFQTGIWDDEWDAFASAL